MVKSCQDIKNDSKDMNKDYIKTDEKNHVEGSSCNGKVTEMPSFVISGDWM